MEACYQKFTITQPPVADKQLFPGFTRYINSCQYLICPVIDYYICHLLFYGEVNIFGDFYVYTAAITLHCCDVC